MYKHRAADSVPWFIILHHKERLLEKSLKHLKPLKDTKFTSFNTLTHVQTLSQLMSGLSPDWTLRLCQWRQRQTNFCPDS